VIAGAMDPQGVAAACLCHHGENRILAKFDERELA
jgi:hypothetical protein